MPRQMSPGRFLLLAAVAGVVGGIAWEMVRAAAGPTRPWTGRA